MSIKQTAVRSLAWAVLESGGLSGLLFITTLILARLLGPAEFGLAALALSVVGILNSSVLSLFHDAIVQRKCLDSDDLHAAFWASLGLGALFSTGCWLMADWIDDIFGQPGLGPVLAWMSLSLIFTGANSVHIAKQGRELQSHCTPNFDWQVSGRRDRHLDGVRWMRRMELGDAATRIHHFRDFTGLAELVLSATPSPVAATALGTISLRYLCISGCTYRRNRSPGIHCIGRIFLWNGSRGIPQHLHPPCGNDSVYPFQQC